MSQTLSVKSDSIDYLINDPIIPEKQKFCCMSLWMSDDKKSIKCLKISGAFQTIEETQEQIQLLKEPGHYNFCAEIGAWNAFDPLPNKGNLNDQLNEMMHRYLLRIKLKNAEYEKRKLEMMIENFKDNKKIKEDELEVELKNLSKIEDEVELRNKMKFIENLKNTIEKFDGKIAENMKKLQEIDTSNIIIVDEKLENQEGGNQFIPIKFEGKINRKNEKLDNQNYYCVTFLAEENKSLVGIKISGCFNTEDEANIHSKSLRDINNNFSILVGELYKWQPFNPEPDSNEAGESEYANEQLNDTMKKKKENEKKAQLYHEYRKYELINKNLQDSLTNKQTEKDAINKKLENITNDEMKKSVEEEILTLEKQIEKLENKKKEISQKETELSEQIGLNELQQKLQQGKISIPSNIEL